MILSFPLVTDGWSRNLGFLPVSVQRVIGVWNQNRETWKLRRTATDWKWLVIIQNNHFCDSNCNAIAPVLSSVFLGNLLPQFGFNPTHLEGESNFTGPRGVTPSQSYLFPNDLTQQVDHISFGGLAEDSWVGNIEPEWIKYGCQEKNLKWSLRT